MIYYLKYTTDLPPNSNGCAKFWMVKIHPDKREDRGIHSHEIDGHVKEWWLVTLASAVLLAAFATAAVECGLHPAIYIGVLLAPFVQPLLYRFCKRYRLWSEVRAYRIQLSYPPASFDPIRYRDMYAGWLSAPGWVEGYELQDICTKEQALAYLS